MIPKITLIELGALDRCRSLVEWNRVCDKMKEDRGGHYPPDWFNRVVKSGKMNRVLIACIN